ncbi:hypothetical protein [Maricaulis sp.]|uniref:hypothetical protein n=1 Tax=Maricaulis sp. TaxID=1486257 RepID=UPI00261ACCAA|nr:hypothetical protein [Maricaulis sp.]
MRRLVIAACFAFGAALFSGGSALASSNSAASADNTLAGSAAVTDSAAVHDHRRHHRYDRRDRHRDRHYDRRHRHEYGHRGHRRYDRYRHRHRYYDRGRYGRGYYGPSRYQYTRCWRERRYGHFRGEPALVSERICADGRGYTYVERGSRRLVRYLDRHPRRHHRY